MRPLKILAVDDENGIVLLIKMTYKKQGFLTFGATDGVKGVEVFEKERPDITFIDIHMPYSPIDGIEVLRRIKVIDKNANCVMLTQIFDEQSILTTKALGAMHYITKPFEIEDLDKCINEVKSKLREQEG